MKTLLIITAVIVGIALIYIFAFAILLWAFYDENYISGYDEFHATAHLRN